MLKSCGFLVLTALSWLDLASVYKEICMYNTSLNKDGLCQFSLPRHTIDAIVKVHLLSMGYGTGVVMLYSNHVLGSSWATVSVYSYIVSYLSRLLLAKCFGVHKWKDFQYREFINVNVYILWLTSAVALSLHWGQFPDTKEKSLHYLAV